MRLIRWMALVAVAALLAALPAVALPTRPAGGSTGGRPSTYLPDSPDPFVLRDGTDYYAYTTNRTAAFGGLVHVPVLQSSDLTTWSPRGDALPELPTWAKPGYTWAPTVLQDTAGYTLFYTAAERASGRQCIGRARADSPLGPFVDPDRRPLICQRALGGSMDPYVFRGRGGARYLYWKNDGNCCGLNVALWGQRLSADERLLGQARRLLRYDQAWERPLIENPAMIQTPDQEGTHWLFYSAGWWSSRYYATGYARCDGALGPCRKVTVRRPWHRSTPHGWGPGGGAFFRDPGGRNWMALHGWARPPGRIGYVNRARRSLFIEKVDFSPRRARVNLTFPYAYHLDPPHPFVDVPAWADTAVTWAYAEQIVLGVDDGPDRRIRAADETTRQEAVGLLRRVLGPGGPTVPDLTRGGAPLTRGQAARLLYTAAGSPDVGDVAYDHPLTDVPPQARRAVRYVVHDPDGPGGESAIAPGYGDLTFRPDDTVSRAGWIRMLHRWSTPA